MLKKQRLTVRFTAGEQQEIELAAYSLGVTPSEFIRTLTTYAAQKQVAELREKRRQEEETVMGEFVDEAIAVSSPTLPKVPLSDPFASAEKIMHSTFARRVTRG